MKVKVTFLGKRRGIRTASLYRPDNGATRFVRFGRRSAGVVYLDEPGTWYVYHFFGPGNAPRAVVRHEGDKFVVAESDHNYFVFTAE